MDILFWKNQSKDIEIGYTSKQFYKQYLYKLEIYAPGCKSIHETNVWDSITMRKSANHGVQYNYGGSWWSEKISKILAESDPNFLNIMKDIKEKYPSVKFRTEEPSIQIYADNTQVLQDIALEIPTVYRHCITKFVCPSSDEARDILLSNKVLVKKQPKYQYKVIFSETKFDMQVRQYIFNYLSDLGDVVRMPVNTERQLTKKGDYLWGCYFYTNDRGIAECVRLMAPDIIREISEMVYIPE